MPASQENRSDAPSTDLETRPAQPLKPSEVLDRAADLIEPEGRWAQGTWARDADGEVTNSERSPEAVCWCLVSALWLAQPEGPKNARRYVAQLLGVDAGSGLVDWNDAPDRSQAEVVQALRQAAELARKEGQ